MGLTREEAEKKAQIIDFQGGYTIALVTEIYNEHETTIEILMKANEEEISRHFNECEKYEAQLKSLQQRNCEGCTHRSLLNEVLTDYVTNGFCAENGFFTKRGFCCNRYEPKETK